MKGGAPRPSQVKSFNYKHVKHTNEEVSSMKMKIEQKWREEIELQDIWYFPESKFFYGRIWYIFYGVDQSSMVINSYFIKLHQSTPGSLIQEPSFFQNQSIQEQSQPLGRHQRHIQAASYREKWIPSDPEKSLIIREQSYPIQEWNFRIAENRFQHTVQQNKHATDLFQLIHKQSPKIQYIPEQSQPLGRHQSHIQAASYREKWIPSDPEKSLSIREQSYPIQEWSFRIAVNRFLHTAQQNQHEAAMMQLIHQSPKIQYIPEQGQPLGRQQSHIQAVVSHRVKWKFYSEKWWIFFPHYNHPPYRATITTNKQESQSIRACSPREVFWVAR
jgi:hypothetical protein